MRLGNHAMENAIDIFLFFLHFFGRGKRPDTPILFFLFGFHHFNHMPMSANSEVNSLRRAHAFEFTLLNFAFASDWESGTFSTLVHQWLTLCLCACTVLEPRQQPKLMWSVRTFASSSGKRTVWFFATKQRCLHTSGHGLLVLPSLRKVCEWLTELQTLWIRWSLTEWLRGSRPWPKSSTAWMTHSWTFRSRIRGNVGHSVESTNVWRHPVPSTAMVPTGYSFAYRDTEVHGIPSVFEAAVSNESPWHPRFRGRGHVPPVCGGGALEPGGQCPLWQGRQWQGLRAQVSWQHWNQKIRQHVLQLIIGSWISGCMKALTSDSPADLMSSS